MRCVTHHVIRVALRAENSVLHLNKIEECNRWWVGERREFDQLAGSSLSDLELEPVAVRRAGKLIG